MKSLNNNNSVNDDHQIKRSTRNFDGLNIDSHRLCVFERDKDGYGFKITGNAPVKVQSVRKDSFAWKSGLRENDIIVEINGYHVKDKQHKDVVALIRKETRVELLVECDSYLALSSTASLSPQVSRVDRYDHSLNRPNSLPKATPPATLPKPKPKTSLQQPTNYTTTQRHNNDFPSRSINESKVSVAISDSPDNTSECSISTTSTESDPPKKYPPKNMSSAHTNQTESQTETPTKSNSYNVPTPNNKIATKIGLLQKKTSPDKFKNKTVPPDGAKSYNPTLSVNDITSNSQITYSTLPKKTGVFIRGRDFDEDNEDEEGSDSSASLIEMLSSTKDALSKPGLVAILLSYVKEKFDDLKIMIFYYTCRLYKSLSLRRDFTTDAKRMANEIMTTFLYEKSPLCLSVNNDIITETVKNFKSGDKFVILFDPILEIIYETLNNIVDDVRGKIKRGIQLTEDVSSFVNSMNASTNPEKELSSLHRAMCNIFNKAQKDGIQDDVSYAIQTGLATMYQFFHKSNFLPGSSIRARSSDCLTSLSNQSKLQTISEFYKITILCAPYQPKLPMSKRKKTKSMNGHNLIDAACTEPEECAICNGLLWGVTPQGIFCTMCDNYYHTSCKKKNKSQCSRKLRKSNSQINNKEEKLAFFGRLSRKSSTNSVRSVNMSVSGENVNNSNFFYNSIAVPDDKTNSMMPDENVELSKSQSEVHLNRNPSTSVFDRYGSNYDLNNAFVNQSIDNGGFLGDQNSVQIQELVQDEALNDPDMKMEESFDAETEINSVFPNIDHECDKKRLIVLLEFYHKTRYILMNLKRFSYSLVSKWPQSQDYYFKSLSLDCIDPFVRLIKSLVSTIEKCIIDKKNFQGLEQAVLDWLSENNDDRLKEWISLSSNLCCTNSLNIIKQMKQTTLRTIPELINLLKAKFHKLVMIEELTQIRPLLISLPLIVKNIIKCLTKLEPKFFDELNIWKQVSTKMDYLCEYIDRCCIPLVDWINNGSILRRSDKLEWPNKMAEDDKDLRDFCSDFPRTLFHFPIFDFQVAKIIAWSTNTKKIGVVMQSTYFKKGTEVLLIFYKNFIVVLQKENDHYVLKPIRPLKNLFDKITPIIDIESGMVVTNGGQEENYFVLNVITNKPDNAFLLRIGFSRLEVVDSWLDYISTKTYNLGRCIAVFKNNDLRSMPESLSHFERTPSNISNKSKASQDSLDPVSISNHNVNFENEEKEEKEEIDDKDVGKSDVNYLAIIDTLTKASEVLNTKTSLCTMLNINDDDFTNHIKGIRNEGIKSEAELTAITYNLSDVLIQRTCNALMKMTGKVDNDSEPALSEVVQLLRTSADILDKWDKSTKITEERPKPTVRVRLNKKLDEDITPEVQLRLKEIPTSTTSSDNSQPPPVPFADNSPDSVERDMNSEVKSIINEIVESSVERVRNSEELRESMSYKYVPAESLLPSTVDDGNHMNEVEVTPTYKHLNSPVDETVTVSRAQIVLQNRKSISP